MSGLPSWQIAEQFGISHVSVLYWARALASIILDTPTRKLIAVDETELKVNGNIVYE